MRKFLTWPKGVPELGIPVGMKDELTPITYAEFCKLALWVGCDDIAFLQFLRHNHFHEIEEDALRPYCEEALRTGVLVLEEGEPVIDWTVTYGGLLERREAMKTETISRKEGTQHTEEISRLIAAAAEAVEQIDADELEEYAANLAKP